MITGMKLILNRIRRASATVPLNIWHHFNVLILAAIGLSVSGCATNSVTGRSQLTLVSEQAAISQGEKSYAAVTEQYRKNGKLITDGPKFKRVTDISNRLISEAVRLHPSSSQWKWDVHVIEEEQLNAWCMPGGKMAVYTGLMDKLNLTDDELAAIMGHEIAHALAGHGQEKMSVAMASNIAVAVLAAGVAGNSRPGQNQQDFKNMQQVGTALAAVAVGLPNSREAESEADRMGIELSSRAGFDPAAAANVWRKMQGGKQAGRMDFFSTHPAPPTRMEALQALEPMMRPLQLEAISEGKLAASANAWIRNSANGYTWFDRDAFMAKAQRTTLLTYNFQQSPSGSSSGVPANTSAPTSIAQSSSQGVPGSAVPPGAVGLTGEKTFGEKLGTALAVLVGKKPAASTSTPSTVEQSAFPSNAPISEATNTAAVSSTLTGNVPSLASIVKANTDRSVVAALLSPFTCESVCQGFSAETIDSLLSVTSKKQWGELQAILTQHANALDVSLYLMGYAAMEKGEIQTASIYLAAALDSASSPSTACQAQAPTSCMGINVQIMAARKLKEIETLMPELFRSKRPA